jgi:hypothetical protein
VAPYEPYEFNAFQLCHVSPHRRGHRTLKRRQQLAHEQTNSSFFGPRSGHSDHTIYASDRVSSAWFSGAGSRGKRPAPYGIGFTRHLRRTSQIHGSATLDMLIRGTGLSQYVVDGTTATLIENILRITSRFLDVLGFITSIAGHSHSRRMTNIALSTDLAPNREPNARALRVHAGSSASRQNSVASSTDESQPSLTYLPGSTLDVNANANGDSDISLEITTQLLILTCYLHILQLFMALFCYIQEYLQGVAKSDDPAFCPIPGLSFISYFPLRKSKSFSFSLQLYIC